jgi:hypothetical protein
VGERWTESMREWRSKYLEGMRIWHEVFETLQAGSSLPQFASVTEPEFESSVSRV